VSEQVQHDPQIHRAPRIHRDAPARMNGLRGAPSLETPWTKRMPGSTWRER